MDALPGWLRMRLDHRWARTRLFDYLDDELSLGQRRRLERHAHICPECGPLLRALTVTAFRLRQLRLPLGRSVAPRVVERLRAEESRR